MDGGTTRSVRRHGVKAGAMALLLIAAIGGVVVANAWKRELVVRDISTRGTKMITPAELVTQAGIEKNQKLYGVNPDATRKRIETNPYIRTAAVVRDAPGRVTLLVEEREPVAVLGSGRHMLLDSAGIILPELNDGRGLDLPFVTGVAMAQDVKPGTVIQAPAVHEALALLTQAQRIGDDLLHRISEVHIQADGDLLCYTAEGGVPVLFGRGALAEKLVKFDSFWKQEVPQHGSQALNYVDLRFDDQVVARWNQQKEIAMQERATP